MCSDFVAPTFQLLQLHFFRVHSSDFHISCCSRTFTSAPAYRKHIQRHHHQPCAQQPSAEAIQQNEEGHNDDHGGTYELPSLSHAIACNKAKWILKVKESQKLTQVCIDSMLQDITELVTVTVSELGDAMRSTIELAGISIDTILGLSEMFEHTSPFCQPFDGLDTYYKQLSYYRKYLNFVVRFHTHYVCMN